MKTKDATVYNKKKIGRFILLFIVLIFMLSNSTIRDKISSLFFKADKTLETIKEIDIEALEEYELSIIDNKVIMYCNKRILQYDFNGEGQIIKEINFSNPLVTLDEANIFVTNNDMGEIQSIRNDGSVIWSKNLDKQVIYILLKENYLVLACSTEEGYQEINIISTNGELKENIIIKNGQAVSAEAYNDFSELLIATINTFEQQIVSNLIKYSKEGNLMWVETFEDEIIQDVKYLKDKSCILVTDKKIYHLNKQKELLWSRENKQDIWDIRIDNNGQMIIVLSKGNLEVMDFNGRTKYKIGLNEDFDRVEYDGEALYLQSSNTILGINENNIFLKYNCDGEIKSMVVDGENIILALDKKIRIMGMSRKK